MRIRLKSGVEWRDVDGEVVLLDLGESAYLSLNGTASVLWPLVAEGTTDSELIDALTARFSIDHDRAQADVETFLERLRSFKLLVE